MRFDVARGQIRNGDLLLFRGRSWWSPLIKLWTRSVYSHVGVALWVRGAGHTELYVVEAKEGFGVRLYPLGRYLAAGERIDWWAISDPQVDGDKVAQWTFRQVGQRYASARQMWRSFGRLGKLLAEWLGIPTRIDRDRWFCSCFAALAMLAGDWQPDEQIDPWTTPPGDVARFTCLQRRGPLQMELQK